MEVGDGEITLLLGFCCICEQNFQTCFKCSASVRYCSVKLPGKSSLLTRLLIDGGAWSATCKREAGVLAFYLTLCAPC